MLASIRPAVVLWDFRAFSQMGLLKRVAPTFGFEVVILLYDLIMIPMYTAFPLAPNLFLELMTGRAVEPLKARQQDVVEDASRNNRINPAHVDLVRPSTPHVSSLVCQPSTIILGFVSWIWLAIGVPCCENGHVFHGTCSTGWQHMLQHQKLSLTES